MQSGRMGASNQSIGAATSQRTSFIIKWGTRWVNRDRCRLKRPEIAGATSHVRQSGGMSVGDLVLCAALVLVVPAVAKFGYLELGIQRPMNPRVILGLVLVPVAIWLGVTSAARWFPAAGGVLWVLARYAMHPGLADYSRAQIRIAFWAKSVRPGVFAEQQARELRNSQMSKDAEALMKRAIHLASTSDRPIVDRDLFLAEAFSELGLLYRLTGQLEHARAAYEQVDSLATSSATDASRLERLRTNLKLRQEDLTQCLSSRAVS